MQSRAPSIQRVGLVAGPALAVVALVALPREYTGAVGDSVAFSWAGRTTAAVAAWMAVWWLTEAVHVTVTALLPIVLLPLLGARSIEAVTAPYAHRLIFLYMGGFFIALAMEKWGLHRRIALRLLGVVGTGPRAMVGGFMLVTALLSMWVSNTATTLMMLPIALSVVGLVTPGNDEETPGSFPVCMMLGIAYGASIGGIGTIIGTPPNLFLAGFARDTLGEPISFARWLVIGLPVVAVFLPLAWFLLCWVLFPLGDLRLEGGVQSIRRAAADLGRMDRGERVTLVVFLSAATAWISRSWLNEIRIGDVSPLAGLTDPGVGMIAGLSLFLIPVRRVEGRRECALDWKTASRLPWGVLILFGGGLSLADSIRDNGVGDYLAAQVAGLGGVHPVLFTLVLVAMVIFLTELTSNFATTATLVPILASVAIGLGIDPFLLIVPATVAASCAFMLPVATPPNAVVFGSGKVTVAQMARAGIWLNLVGIVVVTVLTYAVIVPLLGGGR